MGSLGGTVVWRLPLAQGAILETRDQVPRRAPGAWSLLLPLPVSLPFSLSLSVTIKKKKEPALSFVIPFYCFIFSALFISALIFIFSLPL